MGKSKTLDVLLLQTANDDVDKVHRTFSRLGRTTSTYERRFERAHGEDLRGTQPNGHSAANEGTPLIGHDSDQSKGWLHISWTNSDGKPLYEDDRAWVRWPMSFLHITWQTLASNYVNWLIVFVPAGIVLGVLDVHPVAIFVVNFLAIIPLAALLSFATEELSVKLGQTVGGLMNATFGNAVELIVHSSPIQPLIQSADCIRFPLLHWSKAKFGSCSLVCWDRSCQTSCSCWAVASLLQA